MASPNPQYPEPPEGNPQEPEKRHVHSSYMWLGSLRAILITLFAIAVSAALSIPNILHGIEESAQAGDYTVINVIIGLCVLGIVVVVAVIFVSYLWSYRHLWYEVGPSELSLFSGIFSKKRVHVPYSRIQSVDERASLLQRIFGVCSVFIDTAGGSSNKAIVIPYLTKQDAESLRVELFARKRYAESGEGAPTAQDGVIPANVATPVKSNILDFGEGVWDELGGVFAGAKVTMAPVSYEVTLSNKEMVLANIFAFLQYMGFHARRRGSRIEVERGLLQHQVESVDIARVQSVTVRQSFIKRLLGYCTISVGKVDATTGAQDDKRKGISRGLVIHPFVRVDEAPDVIRGLLPEFSDAPVPTTKLAPVALRRGIIRRSIWCGTGFWIAVGMFACHMLIVGLAPLDPDELMPMLPFVNIIAIAFYVIAAIVFIYDVVNAVFWFRESAYSANRGFVTVKNGGLSNETTSIPRSKIQFGFTSTNPLQNLARTTTLRVRTAAGIGGTTTSLIDITREEGLNWLRWVEPRN